MKKCPVCHKEHKNKVYCSRKCHYDAIGRKPIVNCSYCGKKIKIKKTNKSKRHYCSQKCYWQKRREDIVPFKNEIIKKYNNGIMLKEIAKEMKVGVHRLYSYAKDWELEQRKSQDYLLISKLIKSKKKIDFDKLVKNKKMTYVRAHYWASRVWKITKRPCDICGWNKAERDMHLTIPRLLKKDNARSLCPNCHRLVHRKKLL